MKNEPVKDAVHVLAHIHSIYVFLGKQNHIPVLLEKRRPTDPTGRGGHSEALRFGVALCGRGGFTTSMLCHGPGFCCRGTRSPLLLTARPSLAKAASCGNCSRMARRALVLPTTEGKHYTNPSNTTPRKRPSLQCN